MIEIGDYEPLEWHTGESMAEEESMISEVLPSPVSGLESILLLTLVGVACHRRNEDECLIEFE